MARELRETRLPGVGVKYTSLTAHGGRLDRDPPQRGPARDLLVPPARRRGAAGGHPARGRRGPPARRASSAAPTIGRRSSRSSRWPSASSRSSGWPSRTTSPAIGKTLAECAFRQRTGITIIAILREPEPVAGAQPSDVDPAGRHARHRRQARPVPAVPQAPRRGAVLERRGRPGGRPQIVGRSTRYET